MKKSNKLDIKRIKDFVSKVEENTNESFEEYKDSLMDADAKEENFDGDYTDIVTNSNKARMSKLPWLFCLFLIIIISIILVFMFFNRNPKTVFFSTIDSVFEALANNIDEDVYDIKSGQVDINYNIKSLDENKDFYNELSKMNFKIDYMNDSANNLSSAFITSKYDNQDFLDINVYNDKTGTYLFLKQLFDKYIKTENQIRFNNFYKIYESKPILSGLNQAISKSLSSEKIVGGKQTQNINGQDTKGYEVKCIIDDKNRDRVLEEFVNTIKSNDEFVSVLSTIMDKPVNDVKAALERRLPILKKAFKKAGNVEFKLFLNSKMDKLLKIEVSSSLNNLSLIYLGKKNLMFNVFDKSENVKHDGNIFIEGNKNKSKVTLNVKKFENEKKTVTANINFKIKQTKATVFEKVDVTNFISEESLTDEEIISIYTKLSNNPHFKDILLKLILNNGSL